MKTAAALIFGLHPRLSLAALAAVMLTASPGLAADANADDGGVRMRRFGLMAGFNDGGPSRSLLHFATSDAQAMGKVLETLGGVSREDMLLVQEPTRVAFLAAFDRLSKLVAASRVNGVRREVVVYYSGHSDEEGLLIGPNRVSYDELRARIQAVPADVRLAILDSCASGAFTRHKGGVRRAPFVLDASANTKGHAFPLVQIRTATRKRDGARPAAPGKTVACTQSVEDLLRAVTGELSLGRAIAILEQQRAAVKTALGDKDAVA